jgi:5'-3' exonuclease
VTGREADDEVSIRAWEAINAGEGVIVATIDKDLDQIPGCHYDYRQKVFYRITFDNAEKAFWVQALAGDATDNIPGCYKIGMTKAEKIIQEVIDNAADGIWPTPEEFWSRILCEYGISQARKGCPYADKDERDVALETARLVYMQKRERELWTPPGTPEQWLKEGDD